MEAENQQEVLDEGLKQLRKQVFQPVFVSLEDALRRRTTSKIFLQERKNKLQAQLLDLRNNYVRV